jgi:hypothetical protein
MNMTEEEIFTLVKEIVLCSLELDVIQVTDPKTIRSLRAKRTRLGKKLFGVVPLAEINKIKGKVWDQLTLENPQKYLPLLKMGTGK